MKKLIIVLLLFVLFLPIAYLAGYNVGYNTGYTKGVYNRPQSVRGVYNVTLDGDLVTIKTKLKHLDAEDDGTLIVNGESTFEPVY